MVNEVNCHSTFVVVYCFASPNSLKCGKPKEKMNSLGVCVFFKELGMLSLNQF